MPKPLYIICSESGSEDRVTGSLSIHNLIDRLELQRLKPESQGTLFVAQSMWITTAWARESGDENHEFEVSLRAHLSPGSAPLSLLSSRFVFQKRYHRQVVRMKGQIPISGPGEMRIEALVRKVGGEEWVAVDHVIELIELTNPVPVDDHSGGET